MPLVNCIPRSCQQYFAFGPEFFLLMKFVVYVPKMPLWVESMSSLNPRELESYAGYTLPAFRQVKFQRYNFFECEK